VRKSFNHIKVILGYVWSSSPVWSMANGALIVVRGILPLMLLYLVKLLVDEIQFVADLPVAERDFDRIIQVLIFAGVVFLINALSASASLLVREKQSYVISDFFDKLIHNKISGLDYGYFEHPDYQSLFYRALNEASFRPSRIFYGVMGLIQNLITLTLMAGILTQVHWAVLVILLLITAPVALIRLRHSRKLFIYKRDNTRLERTVNYYNRLITAPDYAKEVRAFDLGSLFRERYLKLKDQWRQSRFALLLAQTRRESLVQVLAAIAFFAVYGMIAYRAFEGEISIGEVVLYFMALQRGYSYLQELLGRVAGLYEDSLFLDNLFEFLKLDEGRKTVATTTMKSFPAPIRKGIEFRDVSFHYPSNNKWILRNLNLTIGAGETVALVGANGAGKSTLIKLLNCLYKPVEGDITIDGVSLYDIDPKDRVANVSVIFQDFILYNVTARENIWFGKAGQPEDEALIRKAAADSGIDKVIEGFEKGYDTTLGVLFEGSRQMSPGQWQSLALARSFYNNGQIILLDEPTSSLDAFMEARLLKYIRTITRGRTSVIVSHRLSTIRMADRIIVLKDDNTVETGTYDELVANPNSHFSNMLQTLSDAIR